MLATLRRFLPYLWPAGATGLKVRIVAALLLVVASKLVQVYGAPFALQGAIDTMASGSRDALWLVVALVAGYAAAMGVPLDPADAVQWATVRGSRSGRIAWQYAVELAGRHGLPDPSAPPPALD